MSPDQTFIFSVEGVLVIYTLAMAAAYIYEMLRGIRDELRRINK